MLVKLFGKKWIKNVSIILIELVVAIIIIFSVYNSLIERIDIIEETTNSIAIEKATEKMESLVTSIISDVDYFRGDLVYEEAKDMILMLNGIVTIFETEENWQEIITERLKVNEIEVQVLDSNENIIYDSSKVENELLGYQYPASVSQKSGNYKVTCFQTNETIDYKVKQYIHDLLDARKYFNDEYLWINEIQELSSDEIYSKRVIYPKDINTEGLVFDLFDNENLFYLNEFENSKTNLNGSTIFYEDNNKEYFLFSKYYTPYNWIISSSIPSDNIFLDSSFLRASEEKKIPMIIFSMISLFIVIIVATVYVMNRNYLYLQLHKEKMKNEIKSTFLSQVSHDLRTPLNAIIGLTDLTLERYYEKELVKKNLEIVKNSSIHLAGIINDILSLSLNSSDENYIKEKNINLENLINSLLFIISPSVDSLEQNIILNVDVVHHEFRGDLDKIKRILENLLGNASKYSKKKSDINFSIIEDRDIPYSYKFIIKDNGIGISNEDQKHVFEAFFRSEDVKRSSIVGTGLGLALVKRLVTEMDGYVELESELGKGTQISVTLNLKESLTSEENSEKVNNPSREKIKGLKVLLVEDHPINIVMEQKILENLKVNVTIAEDGGKGSQLFLKSKPGDFDIILMDILMPVMTGLEATKVIRESNHRDAKKIPIIAISANAFEEDIQECLAAGMNAHVSKPINVEILVHTINKLIK